MLKIMTLNCNHLSDKHGSWLKRKRMTESLIREEDPDVIALQAVCQNPKGKDQARQIAEATGYGYYFFVPAETGADGIHRGQAMITKHPFKGSYSTELSMLPEPVEDNTRRLILVAELPTKQGMLRIFNTHFSWIKEQAKENVEETLYFLNEFSGPGLLIGDLNADSASGVLDPLREAGWWDAWELLRANDTGFTFESNKPFTRIDYAFVSPELKNYLKAINVLNPESGNRHVRVSDHMALVVGLDMEVGSPMPRRVMASSSRF